MVHIRGFFEKFLYDTSLKFFCYYNHIKLLLNTFNKIFLNLGFEIDFFENELSILTMIRVLK